MLTKLLQSWQNRQIKVKTLSIIATCCFVMGLAVPSGLQWIKPSVAETLPTPAPVAVTSSPSTPGSFAAIAENLRPSVVNIKVVKKIEKTAFARPDMPEGPWGDLLERFFQGDPRLQNPQTPRTQQGMGSGVIISKDGFVITNNHVVEGAAEVTVTLADHKEYKGRIVGRDPQTDLAVLKIDSKESFPASTLGDSDNLRVGDWVVAIGNPFGLDHTVTSGIVSAKGRVIGAGPYDNFIQTDASINPGNSGGPLLNMQGEVVGINTAIIPQGQGIGFAIPVNTIKPLIPQLETKGEVTRGYIGVNIQSITPELAKSLNLQDKKGALIADVAADGPAAKAGLKRGDVIVAFNGQEVADSHALPALVAGAPVDQPATVDVIRNGGKLQLPVKVGQLPSQRADKAANEPLAQPAREKWGLHLQDLNPHIAGQLGLKSDQGVVVVGVQPGSRAAEAGVHQGDVILEINQQPISSVADLMAKINGSKAQDQLLLLVQRQNGKLFIPLLENVG